MKFDDTRVSILKDLETQIYYGEPPNKSGTRHGWPCAYMLLYESEELLDEFFGLDQGKMNSNVSQSAGRTSTAQLNAQAQGA